MSRVFDSAEISSWPKGHKRCRGCRQILAFSEFHIQRQTLFGLNPDCKECRRPKSKKQYDSESFEHRLWYRAKSRAVRKGLPFSISESDIEIPATCPVLFVPIILNSGSEYAPSIDQIRPGMGYTPDNICIMSRRANLLKNNATKEELKFLLSWVEQVA